MVAKHAYLDITIKCDIFSSMSLLSLNTFCSDAVHPRAAPPTLALVGAEFTCAPLRLQIRNHRWSSEKSLLDNVLVALSLATLPSPPPPVGASAVEEEGLVALECGICYAYRMQVFFMSSFLMLRLELHDLIRASPAVGHTRPSMPQFQMFKSVSSPHSCFECSHHHESANVHPKCFSL